MHATRVASNGNDVSVGRRSARTPGSLRPSNSSSVAPAPAKVWVTESVAISRAYRSAVRCDVESDLPVWHVPPRTGLRPVSISAAEPR